MTAPNLGGIQQDTKRATSNRLVGKDTGPRLIIIHTMTRDRMQQLTKSNDPSNGLSEMYLNAMVVVRMVSAGGVEPADYHDRGKKMILVINNANAITRAVNIG